MQNNQKHGRKLVDAMIDQRTKGQGSYEDRLRARFQGRRVIEQETARGWDQLNELSRLAALAISESAAIVPSLRDPVLMAYVKDMPGLLEFEKLLVRDITSLNGRLRELRSRHEGRSGRIDVENMREFQTALTWFSDYEQLIRDYEMTAGKTLQYIVREIELARNEMAAAIQRAKKLEENGGVEIQKPFTVQEGSVQDQVNQVLAHLEQEENVIEGTATVVPNE